MYFPTTLVTPLILASLADASPLTSRQSCPNIHVFGARETTAPAGYGSSSTFVNAILNAYPGSTSEAINYPAAGGDSYASSVQQGTQDIANQINAFNQQCPNAKLVVVGYSQVSAICQETHRNASAHEVQGAEIGDNALCGGGDTNQGVTNTSPLISSAASAAIKAVIWAGNPRNSPAESSFHVGSCTAGGVSYPPSTTKADSVSNHEIQFDARPNGFTCPAYSSKIQSYCDASGEYTFLSVSYTHAD